MSSSVSFTGSGFALQSVTSLVSGTVRVRFTVSPLQSDANAANDGLHTANYTLTGPTGAPSISEVNTVSGDTQSLDLVLEAPLTAGTWTLAVADIQTATLDSLGTPDSMQFTVDDVGTGTDLAGGAENDDPARIIRKHLSQAMQGPNWDALIEALSVGDDINWENAQLAFDQLFKTSASQKYLDRLAANDGLTRPAGVGMSDVLFRELSIKLTNGKVVHQALREILEIYYGRDALRASATTAGGENFALAADMTLEWTLDEDDAQVFTHTFTTEQFRAIGSATALEVASALTKTMRDRGSQGLAVAVTDPETGEEKVRIYSGSLGLKSFVRVTGGTAQPVLDFPRRRDVYSGSVTEGLGYDWVYTNPTPSTTKFSLTTTGQPLIDLSTVEEGDYVIVGADADSVEGIYEILEVGYSWSGGDLTQYVIVDSDLDFTDTSTQLSNDAYTFFQPQKRTILSGDRTVVVAQTTRGQVDVQIPATTQAVARGARTGAYARVADSVAISRYVRDGDGVVTVDTLADHGLAVGDHVTLVGVAPQTGRPWISRGEATDTDTGTTDASYGSLFSGLNNSLTPGASSLAGAKGTILGNGDLLVTGGYRYSGGGVFSDSQPDAEVFRITGTETVTDDSEADGATRLTYLYPYDNLAMATARMQHGISTLEDGRALITGGLESETDATDPVVTDTCELTDSTGSVYAASGALTLARFGHQQITLDDGRVMVIGGAWNRGTATETVEFFDPDSETWSTGPNMTQARYGHQAVKLSDGRVLVVGGMALGERPDDADQLAFWTFDESAGGTAGDGSGNGYDLSDFGGSTIVDGKIGRGRDFSTPGSGMLCSGDASATAALLGDWTVEFWLPTGATSASGDKTICAYMGVDDTEAENTLFQIGVNDDDYIWCTWEEAGGLNVTVTQDTGPTVNHPNTYVALRRHFDGAAWRLDLFINGDRVQYWDGMDGNTGGDNSGWYVGYDPETAGDGFAGRLDELRVSSVARTDAEIRRNFWRGCGEPVWADDGYGAGRIGRMLRTTEIYDPDDDSWSPGPAMEFERGLHTATLLPNGEVLVTGGYARNPNDGLSVVDIDEDNWPNTATNTTEIWSPALNRWRSGPKMRSARADHQAFLLSGRDQIWISGGGSDVIELFNTNTGAFTSSFQKFRYRDTGVGYGDYILFGGGDNASNDTLENWDLWVPGADAVSGGGLNTEHKVTAVDSLTRFQFETPNYRTYASNFGADGSGDIRLDTELVYFTAESRYQDYLATGASITFSIAARTSNVTTLTTTAAHGLEAGQRVFVNINHDDYSSGIKTLTSVTATTITYAEVAANVASGDANGTISLDWNDDVVAVPSAAIDGDTDDPGPYIFDPADGLGIRPDASDAVVEGALVNGVTVPIQKGGSYRVLTLDTTDGLDSGGGYLVLDLGGPSQSLPLRYIEVIDATRLLIDFGFVFRANYDEPTVTLLESRGPFVPDSPEESANFYVTGSSIGRVVAESTVRDAAAAGFVVDVNVVYPGDRGLGGEGLPTEGDTKLSDAVKVWGGDELDEE